MLFYGLPVEQLQSFRERVNAVTPDDIERVARYLPAARSAVDRAGRQRRGVSFRSCAASASARSKSIEMDDLDLMAADFKRAGATGTQPAAVAAAPGPARDDRRRAARLSAAPTRRRRVIAPRDGPSARGSCSTR